MELSIKEAIDGLLLPDLARLKFSFEQGLAAFAKVRGHPGIFIGVFVDQLPQMEQVTVEGKWALCRKRVVCE